MDAKRDIDRKGLPDSDNKALLDSAATILGITFVDEFSDKVFPDQIARIASRTTSIPIGKLTDADRDCLRNLEEALAKRVSMHAICTIPLMSRCDDCIL